MKIKAISVVLTWEDGTTNEVGHCLPIQTIEALESFADYWEEKHSDEETAE
jgi:hypothetical protein